MAVLTKDTYNCACSREVCDWSCTTYATMMSDLVPNTASQPFKNLSKPFKTNGDRIRAMTDEELAKLLDHDCPPRSALDVCPQYESGKPYTQEGCYQCRLAWLKQEVSDAL